MNNAPKMRCEVMNEVIELNEGSFFSYSKVVNESGTFKRVHKGLRLGESMTKALLQFIDEKRKTRQSQ